ncbi:FkbM family methyltransferase [Cereibacter sphaeroides]|uniref:FkbM family methyltransferase n=1 Tax=Cereibacter sphaeroides TaxID=1063 RepID=UPI001EED23BA|nr:FkbM family methyltransferase [Cereibacter sphaeroides]MCE6967242.1 FkbM family methyltransferase [Cereibacter sphaeroides]
MHEFLNDITPFFYGKRVTYVDVGAHFGESYTAITVSKIRLLDAHLIEPNPASYAKLEEQTPQLEGRKVKLHNLALGAAEGVARMTAADDMTRVVAVLAESKKATEPAAGSFDIPVTTLDALSEGFVQKRISLLKIDVEGFEEQVLEGARDLLKRQAVDVIYIEAGLDPANPQQCYYRTVEDILIAYGYRIFRIYEQVNDWINDSPVLRRVNLAFMSERFSNENPFRISQELFEARDRLSQRERDIKALQVQIDAASAQIVADEKIRLALEADNRERFEEIVVLTRRLEETQAEAEVSLSQLREQLRSSQGESTERLRKISELQALLEKTSADNKIRFAQDAKHNECVEAIAELQKERDKLRENLEALRSSRSWRITAPMRRMKLALNRSIDK